MNLVGFSFESFQVSAKELDRKFALDAADRFLDVVGNRLGEIPVHAGKLVQLGVHGGDEVVFGLELGAPLGSGPQIHEEFRVVEAAGVAAIIGAAHLADDLLDLGKAGQRAARSSGERHARGRAGARSQRAAHPDRAFIKVRQEFRSDHAAETQKQHDCQRQQAEPQRDLQVIETPFQQTAVALLQPVKDRVAPLLDLVFEQQGA